VYVVYNIRDIIITAASCILDAAPDGSLKERRYSGATEQKIEDREEKKE